MWDVKKQSRNRLITTKNNLTVAREEGVEGMDVKEGE